jgi:hypothetical protein
MYMRLSEKSKRGPVRQLHVLLYAEEVEYLEALRKALDDLTPFPVSDSAALRWLIKNNAPALDRLKRHSRRRRTNEKINVVSDNP